MTITLVQSLVLVCAAGAYCSGHDGASDKTFRSDTDHYTVSYPASWYLFTGELGPVHPDSLDVLSFPPSRRAEGVVLADGGAEIQVSRASSEVRTVSECIRRDTESDTQVRQQEIKEFPKVPGGRKALIEVTSLTEVGPRRNFTMTNYYCSTERGLYVICLSNWEGDKKLVSFRKVALDIALSLRTF